MCGIFAYIGQEEACQVCLSGLKHLEYRGYDSSGIAGIHAGTIYFCKEVGKIACLEKRLSQAPLPPLSLAIAHTRWATHGIPSRKNAHPHFDLNQTVAVVHNGIIENYVSIKQKLIQDKKVAVSKAGFISDTDTEVVAHLISFYYTQTCDFFTACQRSFTELDGSFALAVLHKDFPDQLIAVAQKSPLVVGWNEASQEQFLSSDPNALPSSSPLKLYFLEHGEIAILSRNTPPSFFRCSRNFSFERVLSFPPHFPKKCRECGRTKGNFRALHAEGNF